MSAEFQIARTAGRKKNLPVASSLASMQKALVISAVLSLYIVALTGMFAYQLVMALSAGLFYTAALDLAFIVAFVVMYTSQMIETVLTFMLLDSIGKRDYAGGELAYRRALSIWLRLPVRKGRYLIGSCMNVGSLMMQQGKYESAEYWYGEAYELLEKSRFKMRHPHRNLLLNNIARTCLLRGKSDLAEKLAEEAKEGFAKGRSSKGVVFPICLLAYLAYTKGEYVKAEEYYRDALNRIEHGDSPYHVLSISFSQVKVGAQLGLALVLARQGRIEEAHNHTLTALALFGENDKFLSGSMLRLIVELSDALMQNNDLELAERLLEH
ncbi:MAG TPA: tetratricopeptide repeat protein, partial [Chroococcales cyanobacterium]